MHTCSTQRSKISNMVKSMAQSPHSLEGYLQLGRALAKGKLSAKLREQIALTVAQANRCSHSLMQHSTQARQLGLSVDEIMASRRAKTDDPKTDVALKFTRALVLRCGETSLPALREAGFDDTEIVEIVANVSLNSFENHFNEVADNSMKFQSVDFKAATAAA